MDIRKASYYIQNKRITQHSSSLPSLSTESYLKEDLEQFTHTINRIRI